MAVEKEWLNFFRDQYPVGSQIRLRELENPEGGFSKGQMGTLMEIDEDAKFHIQWKGYQIWSDTKKCVQRWMVWLADAAMYRVCGCGRKRITLNGGINEDKSNVPA